MYLIIFFSLTTYLHCLKALEDNSFCLFYKKNRSTLLTNKEIFWYFIIVKICTDFSIIGFFDDIFNFFPKFNYVFLIIHHLLLKRILDLVSSKSFLYALIFDRSIHKGLIFLASLLTIKNLNPFLPKDTLLDTITSLISIFAIEIGSYVGELLGFWISISSSFITFSIFIYAFTSFCILFNL